MDTPLAAGRGREFMLGSWKALVLSVTVGAICAAGGAAAQGAALPKPAASAVTAAAVSPQAVPAAHALTREDLEAWLDGIVPYALHRGDVAGAVVVVVKDGQVLLQKGYGYADVAAGKPVSPDQTLFRTGSVGKLFTWTAVMQLVEQHKIDLDRDVSAYLDFKIPPAFGKPVTMRQLLQHTGGFEDHAKHLFVDDVRYQMPLDKFLKHNVPARIFPPGEVPAYSNYGATLAGYIVQRVSGEPYAQYVEHHIFAPLGMLHSTFEQPLPAAFAAKMSKGYRLGSAPPQSFELVNVFPAGGASNTGADMGRFMLAHLNDGQLGSAQILQPATLQLMHRQSFQATPPLPGFALGFYREDRNGHAVIAHEGDTNLFHTNLELILDQHVGFFISVNSLGKDGAGGAIRNAVFNDFADRYFPAPIVAPLPTYAHAKRDAALLAGDYQLSRRIETRLLNLIYLMGQVKIAAAPDGTLTVSDIKTLGGGTKRWREVGPFLWQNMDGHDRMAAKVEGGIVKAVWFDETVPAFVFQPVPAWQNKSWILPLLGASVGILALVAIFWPLSALVRWRYGRTFEHQGARARAYRLVRLAALAEVIFIGGMVAAIVSTASNTAALNGSNDWLFRLLQLVGVVGLIGILVGLWNSREVWRDQGSSWWAKTTSVAIVAALASASTLAVMLQFFSLKLDY